MTVTVNEIENRFRNKGQRLDYQRNVVGPAVYVPGGFDVTFGDLEVVEEAIANCDGGYTCEIAAIVGNVVTVLVRVPTAIHSHDLETTGTGGVPPVDAIGLTAGALVDFGAAVPHNVPGGVPGDGVQDIPASVVGDEVLAGVNLAGVTFRLAARGS